MLNKRSSQSPNGEMSVFLGILGPILPSGSVEPHARGGGQGEPRDACGLCQGKGLSSWITHQCLESVAEHSFINQMLQETMIIIVYGNAWNLLPEIPNPSNMGPLLKLANNVDGLFLVPVCWCHNSFNLFCRCCATKTEKSFTSWRQMTSGPWKSHLTADGGCWVDKNTQTSCTEIVSDDIYKLSDHWTLLCCLMLFDSFIYKLIIRFRFEISPQR